jgi:hypothetical protein
MIVQRLKKKLVKVKKIGPSLHMAIYAISDTQPPEQSLTFPILLEKAAKIL